MSPRNGLALAGFIMAIVGAVFSWVPVLGALVLFFALVFSLAGWHRAHRDGAERRGLAIAGTAISAPFLIFALVITWAAFVVVDTFDEIAEAGENYSDRNAGSFVNPIRQGQTKQGVNWEVAVVGGRLNGDRAVVDIQATNITDTTQQIRQSPNITDITVELYVARSPVSSRYDLFDDTGNPNSCGYEAAVAPGGTVQYAVCFDLVGVNRDSIDNVVRIGHSYSEGFETVGQSFHRAPVR